MHDIHILTTRDSASCGVIGVYLVGIPVEVSIKCSEFNMGHNSFVLAPK